MIKKTAVLLSAVCALCPLGAAAVDINESIKIDYENYSVTLTAENGSAAQPIGLYLTDEDGNTAAFMQKSPDENGKAEFSFGIEEEFAGKTLSLRISQLGEKTAQSTLYITKKAEVEAWLAGYKTIKTPSGLEAHTAPYIYSVLKNELNIDDYENYKDRLFDILNNFNGDYKTVSELAADIKKSIAAVKINELAMPQLKVFLEDEETKKLLSVDFSVPEKAYDAFLLYRSDKSKMESVKASGALFSTPYEAVCALKEVSCIAEINAAKASEMKNVLDAYSDIIEKASPGFSALMKRYTAPAGRGLANGNFASIKAIVKKLEASIEETEKESGSTGSGGSDGGGSVKTTYKGADAAPSPEIISETGFSDMDGYDWAEEAVDELVKRKIVNGKTKTSFAPGSEVTREEFVKMAVLLFDIFDSEAETDFSDVANSAWYYKYVASAVKNSIVTGKTEECFGTGENITKQDIVTVLGRALEKRGAAFSESGTTVSDLGEASDYAKTYIEKFCGSGIVKGTESGRFEPLKCATRAESAVIIYNVLKFIQGIQ